MNRFKCNFALLLRIKSKIYLCFGPLKNIESEDEWPRAYVKIIVTKILLGLKLYFGIVIFERNDAEIEFEDANCALFNNLPPS